ncbi:unnamed protein product [Caenorhabditis nigoni]
MSSGSHGEETPATSTMNSVELAEALSRQLGSMQGFQQLLLDKIANMERNQQNVDRNQLEMERCLEKFGLMFQEAAENKKVTEKSSPSALDSKDQEGVDKMLESSSPMLQESENLSQPALSSRDSTVKEGSVQKIASPSTVLATNVSNDGTSESLLMKLIEKKTPDMMKTPMISEADYKVLLENLDRQHGNKEDAMHHHMHLLDQHSFCSDDFEAMEKDLNRFNSIVNVLKSNEPILKPRSSSEHL